jgi:phosphomannomutase
MSLMISISGVRGLIGQTMTPQLAAEMGAAFGTYLGGGTVVVGRDSRPSGPMIEHAVVSGLLATGCNVVNLGIVSTPGTALMVRRQQAVGGVVITASHNPIIWNGIKFLSPEGLAPPPDQASRIIEIYQKKAFRFVSVDRVGRVGQDDTTHEKHVAAVLAIVDPSVIAKKRFRVVLDSVHGAGGASARRLLEELGCDLVHLYAEPTGIFPHTPEPLAENLTELSQRTAAESAAIGFAQDPDADRLVIADEHGRFIGEEYTLALAAKYLFAKRPGSAAANLSTSRMIDCLAAETGNAVHRSPVGEANVVNTMKVHGCTFGGEGNGGVIDPRVVPVRDSLVGMALMLQLLADTGKTVSQLVAEIPAFTMIKQKFEVSRERIDRVLNAVGGTFRDDPINDTDGIRIDWPEGWVHVRASNTEPIMRIIAEAGDERTANALIARVRGIADKIT